MSNPICSADEVHEFWFAGCADDPGRCAARNAFWFQADPETDARIEREFAETVSRAERGALDAWRDERRSCLALVIVLDQLPRSLHRGRSEAFRNDARAIEIARASIASGCLAEHSVVESAFLLMPYQHVEDRALQREGFAHYEKLAEDAAPEWRELATGYREYARKHLDIVERFGRFPHRNPILGRSSTEEEAAYLASGAETFGQGA